MTNSNSTESCGIGFCGALTLLFIGLKLTGYISWSWWWIFAPIWMPLLFGVLAILVLFVLGKWVF